MAQRDISKNTRRPSIVGGRLLANTLPGEEIVISGVSGAFPSSKNVHEFRDNLFNKINMVTPKKRYSDFHPEIPKYGGIIPDVNKFDTGFFGIHEIQSHSLDTLARQVQEKTIEAIYDAGLHPSDFEGTKTGVFIGVCATENEKCWCYDNLGSRTYAITGCLRSMIPHRVSYFLKLKGPSYVTDTACSSSLYALEHAFRAIRLGDIDMAIVGGVQLCLFPFVTVQFARLGVLSKDGFCKVFDKNANGYSRSEAVGILILQRSKDAKRVYARIVHAKSNCDGYKEQGITYPSGKAQTELLEDFYAECLIDRRDLSYMEAHGTGTLVGDPEEGTAIDHTMTANRRTPLLIGSVKSNIGHTEPASGVCSIIKCIIALETGYIPPNINFKHPQEAIRGLIEGRLKVVTDKIPFEDDRGLIGVNSFGFGGGNCHVLLQAKTKKKVNQGLPRDNLPRLVCVSGRTEEAVTSVCDEISENVLDVEHIRLLHDVFSKNIKTHIYRGYILVSKSGELARSVRWSPEAETSRPLYIAFGEMKGWQEIGRQLLELPAFAESVKRFQECISRKGINILEAFNEKQIPNRTVNLMGHLAVQTGIVDVLRLLEIRSTVDLGFSCGKLAAAYCSGGLNINELVSCALIIDDCIHMADGLLLTDKDEKNTNITNGGRKTDIIKDSRNGCNAGEEEIRTLEDLGSFLNKDNATKIREYLIEKVQPVLSKNNKSAENFINYVIDVSPQNTIVPNATVLKLGTSNVEAEDAENVTIITLFEKSRRVADFLQNIGKLYERGYNPQIRELYPLVELPVSRNTRMISPYIKWQHNRDLYLPQYDEDAVSTDRIKQVFITSTDAESKYLQGHVVGGRNLFPATGYLFMVWDTLSQISRIETGVMNIEFDNCKFLRATNIPKQGPLKFLVSIHKETGNFQLTEEESLIVSGRIRMVDDKETNMREQSISTPSGPLLTSKDVYKELSLRGYNYKKEFRAIRKYQIEPPMAHIKWEDNWVTFIDNMLQMKLLETDTRLLYVPTYISKLTIDAKSHLAAVAQIPKDENEQIEIPVYSDRTTGIISCGGITITGLLASSINKRKNKAIPILEKHEFVPNTTAVDIDSSVRINVQIILENELIYKVKVVELMNELAQEDAIPLAPIVQSVIGDQPLIQSKIKILSKTPVEVDQKIEVKEKNLSDEQDCNIVIVSNVAGNKPVLKDALAVLKESGYVIAREAPDCKVSDDLFPGSTVLTIHRTPTETILLLQKQTQYEEPLFIKVSSTDDFIWLPTVQESIKTHHNIVLYSENEPLNGILGLVNCIRREPEGRRVKCVFLADGGKKFDVMEVRKQLKKGFAINIYKDGQWGSYRHLLLRELDTLQCEQAFVKATVRGDLSSLKWMEGPLRHNMTVPQEKELIYVHYATLNFRDVMTASGRLNPDSITPDRIEQECVQGFEFSGIDSRGRRVMGTVDCGAFTTMLLADTLMCFDIPDSWSLADAATVPVVYETVIYGMLVRGGLKRNETVLIHSGTGGVGQAAIRIALHYGCTVYTTVGTEEKREFLKKTYPQLEDRNIGNSRDESFEYMIRRETRGRGVDLVLNSLAEDKLIASVRCLARGGRFVEIGKFDMANNNYLNTALFEKEASFHGTMLDQIFKASPNTKIQLFKLLSKLIGEGAVKPLNRTIFKYEEVEQAFRYMASGKHIGKVLVEIRKPEPNAVNEIGRTFPCIPRFICDPEKTYIILGGLGGFGLELADWLVLRGAKKLVLTSRKGISTGYQNLRTRIWRSYGTIVKISQVDITTKAGCEQLIEESQNLGPVDAIFNLAVVLADALLEDQTPETFATSFVPKAIATEYLDEITRRLCPDLSQFVVFSSMSCGRGNAAQTNYGMSNSVMERICERRKNDGYPALAIQWGAVGEVGLVAEMQGENVKLDIGGTLQQPISNCLQVLDTLLKQKEAEIVSSMVVAEKSEQKSANSVVDLVVNVLGLSDIKSVSFHATLPELGMDSMTAVEIKQNLERDFDIFLTPKDFRNMTLARLKEIQEEKAGQAETKEKSIGFLHLGDIIKPVDLNADSCKPFIPLKSGRGGNPSAPKVLLFPGLEGVAKIYEEFTSLLNADIIGMQFMDNNRQHSIPEIALSLLPYAKEHLTKDTPFKIMAYSFGTVIALEVVSLLESQGYTGTLVCIDGSPLMLKEILRNIHGGLDDIFETALITHLLTFRVSADVISEQQDAFMKCASWEERLQQAAGILKQHIGHDPVYEVQMISGLYTRVKTLKEYTPSYCKIRSTVKLFKSATQMVKDVPDDYGLSELLEDPLEVRVIDGTHLTILMNKELIDTINGYLNADFNDYK